ncbi:phage tail protein [Streptomyces sp. S1D4-20]|uniref:phage tail protein n=1 Tax=Streptomyces sp. S1D4-20 TaxID=2594462 RepID=UPI001162C983|nr:phage tail protein [Streptomyces sp. S1D4-20]QDN58703.1 phage tail protein [Streptomyces sp. S1D4-20]
MSDEVRITVRVNDQTSAGFRDVNGQLRTLDGRFATTAGSMRRSSDGINRGLVDLKSTLLSLAPAAVPVAASLAPIALHAGAAGLAVASFGAALKPQITSLGDVAKAQDKYAQAVTKYGANSQQAAQAQQFVADQLKGMPAATQSAAMAYSNLRDETKAWSDSLAKFTLAPVEKSFAVVGALLPKLTPMVRGASTQLDRLVTVAGGAVNTSGFDALSKKVGTFANSSLKSATDGAIHFMRVLSEGKSSGPIASFFAYAKAQGPAVKELLTNVAKAVSNLLQGAAQAGPGLLSLVNGFAKLVAALPPSLIGNLMQVYAAFKLIKLAGAGIGAAAEGITSLRTAITGLTTASAAAGGGLAGLRAAFMGLSTATKATLVVAGIAAVVAVFSKLSSMGKSAPPDVDKLTTALGRLGSTGEVTGEAASKFGTHFEKLKSQIDKVLDPSVAESVNNWGHSIWGALKPGDATQEFTESVDAIDTSLANLVKGGKANLAKTALADMIKGMRPDQIAKFKDKLDGFKSSLADQALEAKWAAQSQGLFGQAAQDTAAKLSAQKASADGLRQSIQALSEAHRSAYDADTKFEAAVDSATKSLKDNGKTLDIHTEKGRANRDALSQLASATEDAAAKARDNNAEWSTVQGIYDRGRKSIIDNATAITGNRKEAEKLASTLLTMPSPTMKLEMRTEDATRGLNSVIAAMKKTPDHKSVTVSALTGDAVGMLRDLGFKVTKLKDGRFKVTASTQSAKDALAAVQRARDGLKDKTITLSARDRASAAARAIQAAINALRSKTVTVTTVREVKAVYSTVGRPTSGEGGVSKNATGGRVRGYASGGDVQMFPNGGYVDGPGSPTSDSILALMGSGAAAHVSDTEYVVQSSAVKKYGVGLLDALNAGRLKLAGFATGGLTAAEKSARGALAGQFGISHFGRMAGYQTTPFEKSLGSPADLGSLTQALNEAASQIRAAFHGRTEARLEKELDSVGKSLIRYDKQLNSVTRSLDSAKTKLDGLKNSASQLSDSVKSNVLSSSSITQGVSSGSTVTVASLMGGLTQSRDKASAFADALKGLKSKGLSKDLLQQIAEAGVNGGGLETAGALLGASGSEISSINSLQGQIAKAAGAAGKTTSDAVYGAAIKAQEKLVTSLTRQQDKLEKAMSNLAKVMERALAKAVKGKASGGIVGAAASGGLRGGLTWVGEHEPELLDLPVGSRVWSGPDSRRMAGGGGGGGGERRTVVEFRSSGSDVDEFLVMMIRRAVRRRGGDVQLVFTGRRSV